MPASDPDVNLVLIDARSVAEAFPDRFWMPDAETLAGGCRDRRALRSDLDVLPVSDDGDVGLNTARARFGLAEPALIGLTQVAPDGRVAEQQFVGSLSSVEPLAGIRFELTDGSTFWLPPDGRALEEARPDAYALRSTGEAVADPSYTGSWTVHLSEDSPGVGANGFEARRS